MRGNEENQQINSCKTSGKQGRPSRKYCKAHATLIDAMALIQKIHGKNSIFEELSDHIFQSILHAGQGSDRIDVVFDVYSIQSIKFAECVSRGSQEGVKFKTIRAGHKIKMWRRLLTCTETKNKLTKFLVDSWQETSRREKLCGQTMLVACQERCFKLT